MTGADIERGRRAHALLEAGLSEFLEEELRAVLEQTVTAAWATGLTDRIALDAWARVAQLMHLRKEAERRAKHLQPVTGGGITL
jgi:hypothetical protein